MKEYKQPSVSFLELSPLNNIMLVSSGEVDDYFDSTKQNRMTFDAFFAD